MRNTEARPLAWLCELAQEDGTTRQQIVTEDPDGLRWNDMGEPSPFRVTPLYARAALAQQSAAPVAPAPLSERDMLRLVASAATQANEFSDDGTTQQPAASGEPAEHVAEVGPAWSLVWAGAEPLAHVLARHPGVRIGSKLYAAPQPAPADSLESLRAMLAEAVEKLTAAPARVPLTDERPSRADLIAALTFYAEGQHRIVVAPMTWDTVSGEPPNWEANEAGDMVEDGTIAKRTLAGELTAEDLAADDDGITAKEAP